MKPVLKLYLNTLFFTLIFFALCNIWMLNFKEGQDYNFKQYIYVSLLWSIFMSFILVNSHMYKLKKIGITDITDDNIAVCHHKIIKTTLKPQELIQKLKSDPITNKMKIKEFENIVQLKSGMNWRSFGEKITIEFNSNLEENYEYRVSSSPKVKAVFLDLGKKLKKIKRVEDLLTNIS